MRRAVEEIVDPGPASIDDLWLHFDSRCAYCERSLDRERREGHTDHASPDAGNHLGNLVLACGSCNGDEKRDEPWRHFLRLKAPDDATYTAREGRILAWIDLHPRPVVSQTAEATRLRDELEQLTEEFGTKCAELRTLVREPAS